MRQRLPGYPIFGILDRDFVADPGLEALTAQGVYRSRLYSVENYLLDSECWLQTFNLVMRPRGGLLAGWTTPAEIQVQIDETYQNCLPVAAFDKTIAAVKLTLPDFPNAPRYVRSMSDQRLQSPNQILREWGRTGGHPDDLGAAFQYELNALQSGTEPLATLVDGKVILQQFLQAFRRSHRAPPADDLHYINLYFASCPRPPTDAVAMVERILTDATRYPV